MPCFSPLHGFRALRKNPATGKRSITFRPSEGFRDLPVQLPCGQCIGCRLEHSRQWAIRCAHEASLYERNCFITLTYAPDKLPAWGSLDYSHPVKFMKRLRKKFGEGIRSYGCGEYGDESKRPHYHICLFNFDFDDRKLWKTHRGNKYYLSESLQALWPYGHSITADFSFETAAYVARYVTKKKTGPRKCEYEVFANLETGEIHSIEPEKPISVSRRPGIGRPWLEKYRTDVYPGDSIVLLRPGGTILTKPPKYYDNILDQLEPGALEPVKAQRRKAAKKNSANSTVDRLRVRETIQLLKAKKLERGYENER
ncbi:replication initiator protein [Apis mellifera associated microvirus 17]|nr:replication initiator protein [Apis mellifera associated microvirus 17]